MRATVLAALALCFGSGFAMGTSYEHQELDDVLGGYARTVKEAEAAIRRQDILLADLMHRYGRVESRCRLIHAVKAAGPPA